MNPAVQNPVAGRQLSLPRTALFAVRKTATKAVAHALDFDLVAVAATSNEALQKLRSAVKYHVEFGFNHHLSADEVEMSAPQECWDRISDCGFTLGEDIEVDHQRIRTMTRVIDESELSSAGAR